MLRFVEIAVQQRVLSQKEIQAVVDAAMRQFTDEPVLPVPIHVPIDATKLLSFFLSQENCNAIVGDLEERYFRNIQKQGPSQRPTLVLAAGCPIVVSPGCCSGQKGFGLRAVDGLVLAEGIVTFTGQNNQATAKGSTSVS